MFGEVNFRGGNKRFGIKTDDRRRHIYLIGKTGMGKTTLLENMVAHDILTGRGVGVVDPHGEFAEKMLDLVPKERLKDVVYFNPADIDYPIAFNPIEKIDLTHRHLVASGLMGVFKKIWPDVWSARMEYILNNSLLTLLEFPDSTLLDVMRLLSDKNYRDKIVEQLKDPVIKAFWINEFARYAQKFETEATAAIQNKVGKFVSNPLVRHILGQSRSSLDFRKAMDNHKILIFNLSKGKIGEDNSSLLGAMVITKLQLAAMSRVDVPEPDREDFFLYVDEFQNFATDSFANIMSEARKYRLSLTLAHQYIGQLIHELNTKVRDAVFGNVGTIIAFRVGAEDAEFLEKEFTPEFLAGDLVNLPKANFYIKLMIDGIASRPFSARGIPPVVRPPIGYAQEIIENTRKTYATPIKEVEARIAHLWAPIETEDKKFHAAARIDKKPFLDGFSGRPRFPARKETAAPPAPAPAPVPAPVPVPAPAEKKVPLSKLLAKEEAPAEKPPEKPRPKVDVEGLKQALQESLKKKKE